MLQNILKKLSNTKTLIAVISGITLILTTWGIQIPVEKIDITVKALCSIGVLLGVLNDKGMTTTKWNQ
ncbi:MAG: hypothetical protein FH761_08495 [Firmicutes bacterium]|nr:hypothetical protein [Bacillota bacterium]